MFLESQFKAVSAIWATDINENVMLGFSCPMVVVHNPGAVNPIPEKLLPAQSEYVALREGDQYVLETRDGCLAERSKT